MKLNVVINSEFYNRWPKLRIYNNDQLIDSVECNQTQLELEYTVNPANGINKIVFEHHGKNFGDNNIWDVDFNRQGELQLRIVDIKFDDVSIDHLINELELATAWTPNQLVTESTEFKNKYNKFVCAGMMVFNGRIEFEYTTPIYEFLIEKKYKVPLDTSIAFFSNKTELFHYDAGLAFAEQIKKIIKQHE
jgi:hypothetical protein